MSSVPGFWAAGCFFLANTGDIFHRCQSFQERLAALFRPLCLSWTPKSNGEGEGEPTTFVRSMGAGCRLGSAQCPHQGPLQYIYLDPWCIPPFSLCGWWQTCKFLGGGDVIIFSHFWLRPLSWFSWGGTTWTGDFKCREVKTGFCRNRSMQTGSWFFSDSHWLGIWSNHLSPSMGPNGGRVAMDSVFSWSSNFPFLKSYLPKKLNCIASLVPFP